ncbi:unnamed protein product [Meloidogyne enterolobii]|uniref:Uncharacterized protein n=1 Tax=Meloidogyne enterolobii TaxID=390850 RepID=A0ACB0XZZ8_MELEN
MFCFVLLSYFVSQVKVMIFVLFFFFCIEKCLKENKGRNKGRKMLLRTIIIFILNKKNFLTSNKEGKSGEEREKHLTLPSFFDLKSRLILLFF